MAFDTPDGERYENEGWFTRFTRARRNEIVACLLGAVGLFLLVSTLTYDPLDPSFNTASSTQPTNLFGAWGAMASDMSLQWLGWGGAALGAMLFAWGVIFIVRGPRRRGPKIVTIRLIAGAMAVAGLCTAAASLPMPTTWPLAVGLGGAIGDLMHGEVVSWLNAISLPAADKVAAALGLGAALLGLFAGYGVTPNDIADAADSARRLSQRTKWAVQSLTDRYLAGLDEGVVRLQPLDDTKAIAAPQPRAEAQRFSEPLPPRASEPPRRKPAQSWNAGFGADADHRLSPATPPAPERPSQRQWFAGWGGDDLEDGFELPPLSLLREPPSRQMEDDEAALQEKSMELETVLLDFGVRGQVVNARPGPVVTLYEFEPAPGVKSSRVISLADDIARSMSAVSARVAVVPGRNVIGIELPNDHRETVFLRSLLDSDDYHSSKNALPLALGETIEGEPFVADLSRMPHLLIAGTTGSGKSVGINAMILSLMYKLPPERCRFLMIDPKMLELSVYDGAPHLITPVVTDPRRAVSALKWTVREMESRYRRMSKVGVRNIAGFNRKVEEARAAGEMLEADGVERVDDVTGDVTIEPEGAAPAHMPYLVVVIDEMADLMLVAGKDIEAAVQRLAQMARAAGIHLITATQRPSVDVITGTIKANFPTRLSFQVTAKVDSRTILGEQGAEQLLGQGDLLHMAGGGRIQRLHGPFVSDDEVERIAAFVKAQGEPEYLEGVTDEVEDETSELLAAISGGSNGGDYGDVDNELFDQAVAIVTADRRASTSYLQRRLKIGYNRAATLMERLEAEGVVSAANHAGKREVLAAPPPKMDEDAEADADTAGAGV
ncbi:MAG: DNA translocase FtsK 4TM domain-containing protein [Maricaulaceae bacterium]|jgi:S-DNA-T family DNA segregation ATPase FtsK/SpoIIIE